MAKGESSFPFFSILSSCVLNYPKPLNTLCGSVLSCDYGWEVSVGFLAGSEWTSSGWIECGHWEAGGKSCCQILCTVGKLSALLWNCGELDVAMFVPQACCFKFLLPHCSWLDRKVPPGCTTVFVVSWTSGFKKKHSLFKVWFIEFGWFQRSVKTSVIMNLIAIWICRERWIQEFVCFV